MTRALAEWSVHRGDVVAWLRGRQWLVQNGYIPKAHAVFCDPPYFLGSITKRFGKPDAAPAKDRDGLFQRQSRGFMGQTWDGFESPWHYQAWVTEWASLLLDFVHPGAVLAAFGGTRTYHRLATGLEEAGWDVFDSVLAWMYGSGFPKSHDISKALDREAGAERERIRGVRSGVVRGTYAQDKWSLEYKDSVLDSTPITPAAERWNGYGTALKPSYEPLVLARAPRSHTFAALAREFGTGALNVNGTRIGTTEDMNPRDFDDSRRTSPKFSGTFNGGKVGEYRASPSAVPAGRWPANTLLVCACEGADHAPDCPVAVLDAQSGESVSTERTGTRSGKEAGVLGRFAGQETATMGHNDSGTASRFFYTAKAARWEREAGLDRLEHVRYNQTSNNRGAEQWENTDQNQSTRLGEDTPPPKDTIASPSGIQKQSQPEQSLRTSGNGNNDLDLSLTDTKSTISTATSKTTESKISNSLTHSRTNECIQDANLLTENGGSPAQSAGNTSQLVKNTGTSQKKDGRYTVDADLAISESSVKRSESEKGGSEKSAAASEKEVSGRVRRNTHPT